MPTRPIRLALFAGCLAALSGRVRQPDAGGAARGLGGHEHVGRRRVPADPRDHALGRRWVDRDLHARRGAPFTGRVDGTLANGVLEGALVVSEACRFGLVGTVSGDALEATFAPTGCPGGAEGTWTATRTTPGPLPDPPGDDAASFDGGATFDTARFR